MLVFFRLEDGPGLPFALSLRLIAQTPHPTILCSPSQPSTINYPPQLHTPQPSTTPHNPPQPSTTLHNPPQPSTTLHNPPQPSTTLHNSPHPSTTLHTPPHPSTTLHNPPQPSTTLHNQGRIRHQAAPEAVGHAVGRSCQSGWGQLLSTTDAIEGGLAARETVTGHRLGALDGGGGGLPMCLPTTLHNSSPPHPSTQPPQSSGPTAPHTHDPPTPLHRRFATQVDINAVTEAHLTPLMCAANNGHLAIVQRLITNGADLLAVSNAGLTAADFAHQKYHNQIAAALDREMVKHMKVKDIFAAVTAPDMVFLKYTLHNKLASPNAVQGDLRRTLLMAACTTVAPDVSDAIRLPPAQGCIGRAGGRPPPPPPPPFRRTPQRAQVSAGVGKPRMDSEGASGCTW